MAWLIEKILGNCPSNNDVKAEFKRRNLTLDDKNILIVMCDNNKYTIHGHQSTQSDNYETAVMKFLITCDYLDDKELIACDTGKN